MDRAARRAQSKLVTLDLEKTLASSGMCLLEWMGFIHPWILSGGKRDPGKLVNIKRSHLSGSGVMYPDKKEVRQKFQETCTDEQQAPGQTQTEKGSLQMVGTRTCSPAEI